MEHQAKDLCDAGFLIVPKREVLVDTEITYDREDIKDFIVPKDERSTPIFPLGIEASHQTNTNILSAIKTETVLSEDIAELQKTLKCSEGKDALRNVDVEIKESRHRITSLQRRLMLEFVKKNSGIVTGRFAGPDGARTKARVLAEMAYTLNSTGSGAVKTPDKWLRSFQDWKSDVKKKAAKIASHARGTGGGPPISVLSDVERDLVDLIGEPAVSGHNEISDPLEGPSSCGPTLPEDEGPQEEHIVCFEPSEDPEPPGCQQEQPNSTQQEEPKKERKRKRRDEDFDDRMVAAVEQHAKANAEIARQIGRLADIGMMFYNGWARHNNIHTEQNEYNILPNQDDQNSNNSCFD